MKNIKLKMAILGVLGIASAQVYAAGSLCALAAAPTGSAYIDAYNSGRVIPPLAGPATTALNARMNFGTTTDGGSAGNCEITSLANDSTTPVTGYTLVVSASRTVPTTTGGSGNIGTVTDRIWRNSAGTMCIFGTKFTAANADHDSSASGTQYFEVNDIARGGFSSSGTVNVGYFKQATNASRVYRVGRTFTSVQHRAYRYGGTTPEKQNNGTGYLDLPTIGGSNVSINGNDTVTNTGLDFLGSDIASASASQQEALVIATGWTLHRIVAFRMMMAVLMLYQQ